MVQTNALEERARRNQAVAEAANLFEQHGDGAAVLLQSRIHDPATSADERRFCRLARTEVERLGRIRRSAKNGRALATLQPPMFSWARLAKLFGLNLDRSRKPERH